MRNVLLAALLLSACATSKPPAPAAPPAAAPAPARAERFDVKVRGYFFDGFRGDPEALATGMKKTEAQLAAHPDDAEALVWHGAGLAFQAGAAFRRGDRQAGAALYEQGIAEVDRAKALAPDHVSVLVPRAAMYIAMTMFMPDGPATRELLAKGVADYEAVLRLQRETFAGKSTHVRGQLLYGLADGYSRLGEQDKARAFYQRLVSEVPDSPLAPRASDWLAGKPHADKVTCIGCHEG